MSILSRVNTRMVSWCQLCEWSVLGLVVISILWRGGKSLEMTWLLLAVTAIVLWSSRLHEKRTGKEQKDVPQLLWIPVMGFMLLTFLSYLFSTTQNYGFDELLRTGSVGLLFIWMVRKTRDEEEGPLFVRKLIRTFAITIVVACVIGLMVYIFQPVDRFVGTFFDHRFHTDYWPNAWAELLLLGWPIVLYWDLRDIDIDQKSAKSRIELLIRSAILGLVFGALLLSYSRAAWLVLAMQLSLWAGIIYYHTRPIFPWKRILPFVVLVSAVALLTFLGSNSLRSQYYAVQDVGQKITFRADEGRSSVSERAQFWSQSLFLGLEKPLLGWGPYSFRFVQPELQKGILATSDHPHNVLLKIAMERGVIAMLLFASVVLIVFYRAGVAFLSREIEVGTLFFSIRVLCFIALVGLFLHNLVDFNLQFVGILLPTWLFLGMLLSFLNVDTLRNIPSTFAIRMELVLVTVLLMFALYEGVYLTTSSIGRHAEARGEISRALEWYKRARGEWFSRDLHLSRAKLLYEESLFNEAQGALDAYFSQNEEDARAWKRQGDVSLLRGEKQKALHAYQVAYKRAKYNDLGVLRGLLDAYLALDQKERIDARKEEFDSLLREYADAVQKNTHFIALSANVEEFITIANGLARLYPEDAPMYQVLAARVDHNAKVERDALKSRPPGFLW